MKLSTLRLLIFTAPFDYGLRDCVKYAISEGRSGMITYEELTIDHEIIHVLVNLNDRDQLKTFATTFYHSGENSDIAIEEFDEWSDT